MLSARRKYGCLGQGGGGNATDWRNVGKFNIRQKTEEDLSRKIQLT